MKSRIISKQLESILQVAKHTLASRNPKAQPVSKGLLMENSKIFPKGSSVNIVGSWSCSQGELYWADTLDGVQSPVTFSLHSFRA